MYIFPYPFHLKTQKVVRNPDLLICMYCTASGIKSQGSSYSCSICTEEEYIEKNPRANSIAYSSIDSSIEKNPRANPIAYSSTDSSLFLSYFLKLALLLLQPMCHTETAGLAQDLQPMFTLKYLDFQSINLCCTECSQVPTVRARIPRNLLGGA